MKIGNGYPFQVSIHFDRTTNLGQACSKISFCEGLFCCVEEICGDGCFEKSVSGLESGVTQMVKMVC